MVETFFSEERQRNFLLCGFEEGSLGRGFAAASLIGCVFFSSIPQLAGRKHSAFRFMQNLSNW